MTTNTQTAYDLGVEFANELNQTPRELQNWSPLEAHDDLPEEDYITLRREFGDVTREMEQAYKTGFNATAQFIR